jgi:hypothetical protein
MQKYYYYCTCFFRWYFKGPSRNWYPGNFVSNQTRLSPYSRAELQTLQSVFSCVLCPSVSCALLNISCPQSIPEGSPVPSLQPLPLAALRVCLVRPGPAVSLQEAQELDEQVRLHIHTYTYTAQNIQSGKAWAQAHTHTYTTICSIL